MKRIFCSKFRRQKGKRDSVAYDLRTSGVLLLSTFGPAFFCYGGRDASKLPGRSSIVNAFVLSWSFVLESLENEKTFRPPIFDFWVLLIAWCVRDVENLCWAGKVFAVRSRGLLFPSRLATIMPMKGEGGVNQDRILDFFFLYFLPVSNVRFYILMEGDCIKKIRIYYYYYGVCTTH